MGNVDVRVDVISVSMEAICGGSSPGARGGGAGAGADVGGGFTRGATGVFSLLVSCEEEAELEGGNMGDDGSGDMKFSVDSDSA